MPLLIFHKNVALKRLDAMYDSMREQAPCATWFEIGRGYHNKIMMAQVSEYAQVRRHPHIVEQNWNYWR